MNNLAANYIPGRILFQWHITERCDLHCSHCYQEHPPATDPSLEQLLIILEQFKSFIVRCRQSTVGRAFRAHITVTGGEPFLREDFPLLLERVAGERQLFSFAVLTNGTLLSPEMVSSLGRLRPSFVQVSIDGSRETHDSIRGAKSHERAVAGIRLLVGAKIPTYISFTAHRSNYRDFPKVAQMGRRLGVARVWADRMVPCVGGDQAAELLLTQDETRQFVGIMELERRRNWLRRSPVVLHRSLQFTAGGTRPYRCSAGDTLITVLPNGDVCPCRRMPLVVGNMHSQSLEHLYQNSGLFHALRDRERVSSGCERCFYAHTCQGGARCIAQALHGDPYRADPGCWLAAS